MKHYTGFLIRQERLRQNLSQEGLCKGICAVSYLSKIEQGQATPSPEVLNALFRALGVQLAEDPALLKRAEQEFRAYFRRFFLYLIEDADEAWLLEHGRQLSASRLALTYRLFRLYRAIWKRDEAAMRELVDALAPFRDYLDDGQLFLMTLGSAMLRTDGESSEKAFIQAERLHPCAFVAYHYADLHFRLGRYVQGAREAEKAYERAAEEGNGRLLLYSSALVGLCYANQHHYPLMMRYFSRSLALAQSLEPDFAGQVQYNIGATCLELRRYEEALEALEACLAFPAQDDDFELMACHKLAIVHAQLGHAEDARRYLERASALYTPSMPPLYQKMLRAVEMRLSPGYLSDPSYVLLLREIYDESAQALHFGFRQFHGYFLIEAYAHQRRYKDALSISREISEFSYNIPLNTD